MKIGVIFGGNSVEHEISIISAVQAMGSIDRNKYQIIPIYITKKKEWYTGSELFDIKNYHNTQSLLKRCKKVVLYENDGRFVLQNLTGLKRIVTEIDLAFPIVHGTNVEDGSLQGYLETIGIPYVGPNVLASALGQDKVVMKQVFNEGGLPIVPFIWCFDQEYQTNKKEILKAIDELGYPVMVKPANLGSSIGITKAKNKDMIEEAIEEAFNYDSKVVVEKVIENLVEVNCSVIGNYTKYTPSVLEEVMGSDEFLSYQDKYVGNKKAKGTKSKGMAATNRVIPARIDNRLTKNIQDTALAAARLINTSGVVRIDFLIDKKTEKYYINEINSIPGSLAFYLWPDKNLTQLTCELIEIALHNAKIRAKKIYSFDTNILETTSLNGSKGAKKGK